MILTSPFRSQWHYLQPIQEFSFHLVEGYHFVFVHTRLISINIIDFLLNFFDNSAYIAQTQPNHKYYVRCIKPNHDNTSATFDPLFALRQMRAMGMLESIRVRKMGYSLRYNPLLCLMLPPPSPSQFTPESLTQVQDHSPGVH